MPLSAPCLQTRRASPGRHKERILKLSQIDKKGAVMERIERIAAKRELAGWVDGDDAYMLLKVGQFECTVKAHKHSTDFLALSQGLLGALAAISFANLPCLLSLSLKRTTRPIHNPQQRKASQRS
jgi:hypothetical protein